MKKKTDEQTELLKKQIEEQKSKYLRALADYQNLEKRAAQEQQDFRKHAAAELIRSLLAVLDALEKAQDHLKDEGLKLAIGNFQAVLKQHGLVKIEVLDKPFNPHEMECVEVASGEDSKVIEEIQTGYKMHGKILRAAKVKVGQTKSDRLN